ncbi:hypothetical protein KGF54_000391 [Candida jiufengensis]|uniref:uncharacterized protein n=1 Tax=Candida jiufengensis TaxID=497108 RepID=UPI0022247BA8|nr:uncharacterized protein KGF54_000391 [Candida jiufengensis]KAI5956774.1 hypothetical protein KGF54_000391 [Candida jiufengensis]
MIAFNNLPIELIEKILLKLDHFDNIPQALRHQWYYHVNIDTTLTLIIKHESKKLYDHKYRIFVNSGAPKRFDFDCNFFLADHERLISRKSLNLCLDLIDYLEIWCENAQVRELWYFYLFTYPFCFRFNSSGRRNATISDLETLEKEDDIFENASREYNSKVIQNLKDRIGYFVDFKFDNFLQSIYRGKILLLASSLRNFANQSIVSNFDPTFLNLRIVYDGKTKRLPIDDVSDHQFENLVAFELELLGKDTKIDSERDLIDTLGENTKRITISIPKLNVHNLLSSLNYKQLNYLWITTKMESYGEKGSIRRRVNKQLMKDKVRGKNYHLRIID